MGFFSNSATRPTKILLLIFLAPFIIYAVGYGLLLGYLYVEMLIENRNDAEALYALVAEAEANIQADPDFVNPIKEGFQMAYIPDKYYSYVKSERVYSRAYVVIYQDGTLDAFYGTSSYNLEHLSKYRDRHLIPAVCGLAVMIIVPVSCLIVFRIRKKKAVAGSKQENDTEQP